MDPLTTTDLNTNSILGGYATFGAAGITAHQGTTWAVANGGATAISGLVTYTASTGASNFVAAANYDAVINDTETGPVNTLRFNTFAPITLTLSGASTLTSGGILVTPSVGCQSLPDHRGRGPSTSGDGFVRPRIQPEWQPADRCSHRRGGGSDQSRGKKHAGFLHRTIASPVR